MTLFDTPNTVNHRNTPNGPCLLRVTKRARGGRGFRVAQEIMPLPRNGVLALE